MDKQGLIEFEVKIKELFLDKRILYPCHLSGGNEDELIKVFQFREGDWVFSTHRNHYHALLSYFTPDELKSWIIKNGSMHVYKDRFFTSGIVGGIIPIAVGVALGIKRRGGTEKVWCFIGDMAAETGISHESAKYAYLNELPITFIIEDNGYSVDTPTREAWGQGGECEIIRYEYKRVYPHVGAGAWITF